MSDLPQDIEKVHFELDIEEEGFPPISVESLNGERIANEKFRLENTPFFASGVALGDMIRCSQRSNMNGCWFDGVEEESGNKAISIIFLDEEIEDTVYQRLKNFGCYCEYGEFGELHMLAVCIFKSIDYSLIVNFLDEMEGQERLSYAELCVS